MNPIIKAIYHRKIVHKDTARQLSIRFDDNIVYVVYNDCVKVNDVADFLNKYGKGAEKHEKV